MAKLLKQYGALPVMEISGTLHVLLITSRVTHRWIIPKGHPEKKMQPSAVAVFEAREEAGVSGAIGKTPIGRYRTRKCLASGKLAPCEVTVFQLDVSEHLAEWKTLERKSWGPSRFLESLTLQPYPSLKPKGSREQRKTGSIPKLRRRQQRLIHKLLDAIKESAETPVATDRLDAEVA